jgi:tetratricopeptide (TPR) repeat protein
MAKQEIKQEQVLNVEEAVSRSEAFINKNKKTIVGIVCAIVILIAGSVLLTTQYIRPREQKAAEALFAGERYFQNGNYETALNGDQNEYAGFEAVINEFGGTKAGKLAKAYAGISLAKLGRHEEAIPYLKSFKGDDVMVAPSVLAALGNCYAQMGNEAQAAATLIKAAQKADNNLLSPAYLIQAGQIYEKLGKNSDALKAYQEVKDKYYGSTQAMDIDRYIERVK